MATNINRSRLGAMIAQKRAQRARELMQIFKRVSNIKKQS